MDPPEGRGTMNAVELSVRHSVAAAFVWCACLLGAVPAQGRPPPDVLPARAADRVEAWLERARLAGYAAQRRRGAAGLPPLVSLPGAGFDYSSVDADVSWDPDTGVVDATVQIDVSAQNPSNPAFYLLVDRGLAFTSATAAGYTVTVTEDDYPPYNYATVTLSPLPAQGEQLTLELSYAGTLQCQPYGARGHRGCGSDGELDFMMDGAALPLLMDGADPYGFDTFSRSLTLHMPSGRDVIVSADWQSSDDDGTTLTTRWHAAAFSSSIYLVVLAGDFGTVDVASVSPPFVVAHQASSPEWTTDMAGWMSTIVPFLDGQSGTSFPFAQVTVFKLPELDGFPGTASHSMVYLSEVYGSRSAEEFEETLAHETSHLWWGVLATPYDPTLWLVEGLAVLSQYDYTASAHYTTEDRHAYLGSRYHWNELLLKYLTDPATLPPLVLGAGEAYPSTLNESVTWAYFKSSATLDYLRLAIGEAAFAEALQAYRAQCTMVACTTDEFRSAVETAAGRDLGFFFEQWVYASSYPELTVGFSQQPNAADDDWTASVELRQAGTHTVPVVLLLELLDGSVVEHVVTLEATAGSFAVAVPGPVRAVRPSPRQDAILWSRSAQSADPDFSNEVDGRDLIHCARGLGHQAVSGDPATESIYAVDLDFDSRCDFDGDADVDDADVQVVLDQFGAGVTREP